MPISSKENKYLNVQVTVNKRLNYGFNMALNDYRELPFFNQTKLLNNPIQEGLKFDVIICDEAHTMGAFPKPSKRAKQVKDLVKKSNAKVIFLSGTPTPESYSQIYHQLYVHPNNPFRSYVNFYRWANDYVKVKIKYIGAMKVNDYSGALKDKIMDAIKHLMISFTQEQAGFSTAVEEAVLHVKMRPLTYRLTEKLKKDFPAYFGSVKIEDILGGAIDQIKSGLAEAPENFYEELSDAISSIVLSKKADDKK